jgi:hypothetical protein
MMLPDIDIENQNRGTRCQARPKLAGPNQEAGIELEVERLSKRATIHEQLFTLVLVLFLLTVIIPPARQGLSSGWKQLCTLRA